MSQQLPTPRPAFEDRKAKILSQLAVPDADYTDLSPKGSVDEGIRPLMGEVNAANGFVTTSSCAGRVSVFLEGRKAAAAAADAVADDPEQQQLAGVGGKGGGGTWLFVSHDPHPRPEGAAPGEYWVDLFGLGGGKVGDGDASGRLIHFKFEPMILHVLTASHAHAQLLLRCALHAGFRESGAVSLLGGDDAMPIVAVRSMGLSFESLVGVEADDGTRRMLVDPSYLEVLMRIAHERFEENTKRIQRFAEAFENEMKPRLNADGKLWEDAEARRERMREEGLRRKAEKIAQKEKEDDDDEDEYMHFE